MPGLTTATRATIVANLQAEIDRLNALETTDALEEQLAALQQQLTSTQEALAQQVQLREAAEAQVEQQAQRITELTGERDAALAQVAARDERITNGLQALVVVHNAVTQAGLALSPAEG